MIAVHKNRRAEIVVRMRGKCTGIGAVEMVEHSRDCLFRPKNIRVAMKIDNCSRVAEDKRVRAEGYDVASPLSFDLHTWRVG